MDFFDSVVNKSNAIIKERLNNPFGAKSDSQDQPAASQAGQDDAASFAEPASVAAEPRASLAAGKQSSQDSATNESDRNKQFAAIAADAEAVAQKAAKGAQKFGTFLFSMANKAGQTVSQTAKQVKQAVENTSILNDLTREQQEFVREHGGSLQAGELPWSGQPDETRSAYIREQVLSLSQDKRNFVRAPPSESRFQFDPKSCYPVALTLLKEDPNLNRMRYELVPKLVNEDTFWCNYFYRVSMLKQMSEKSADARKGWASSRSSSGEGPDEVGSIDAGHQPGGAEPASPSYDTPATTASAASNPSGFGNQQQYTEQTQDGFSLVNTDRAQLVGPGAGGATGSSEQPQLQYQSSELESSESRKLVAEADDLKSRLRELNIGSFSIDGQDEGGPRADQRDCDLEEFELISRADVEWGEDVQISANQRGRNRAAEDEEDADDD